MSCICSVCGNEAEKLWVRRPSICMRNSCRQAYYRNKNKQNGKQFNGIKKVSQKQAERIKDSNIYYQLAIDNNIVKNRGCCRCDECARIIENPGNRNVCHVISAGANASLYLEPTNNYILGRGPIFNECGCGEKFDSSTSQSEMKIWPERCVKRETLNHKYYSKSQ